jgi:hypothetical protein
MLAKGGQAEAAIVIAPDAGEFARWLAGELAGHLKKLSGAELPIVTADKLPAGKPLVVLGGPQANPLAAAADQKQLARFAGLKPDGFVLKRIDLDGVPVLLAGGNDEAAKPVIWTSAAELGDLAGKPLRLKFRLLHAYLFSFQFQQP